MIQKRRRGRPQRRPDENTRKLVFEAARVEFEANGYAATTMENVARRAAVSTRTLYRLVPNKAGLLKQLVSDRFDQFVIDFKLRVPNHVAIEVGLHQALAFCATVVLDPDIVALRRLILRRFRAFQNWRQRSTRAP